MKLSKTYPVMIAKLKDFWFFFKYHLFMAAILAGWCSALIFIIKVAQTKAGC